MKHYLENIDEVCRDVKTGVDGVSKFIGLFRLVEMRGGVANNVCVIAKQRRTLCF